MTKFEIILVAVLILFLFVGVMTGIAVARLVRDNNELYTQNLRLFERIKEKEIELQKMTNEVDEDDE